MSSSHRSFRIRFQPPRFKIHSFATHFHASAKSKSWSRRKRQRWNGEKSKSTSGKTIWYLDGKQLNRNAEHSDLCWLCYHLTLITVLKWLVVVAAAEVAATIAFSQLLRLIFAKIIYGDKWTECTRSSFFFTPSFRFVSFSLAWCGLLRCVCVCMIVWAFACFCQTQPVFSTQCKLSVNE